MSSAPTAPNELALFCIERVMASGAGRAVIDLFPGTGLIAAGTLIHDLDATYRVDLVLLHETRHGGARVLTSQM